MRISDWSSDVCSSDLTEAFGGRDQIGLALDPQPFRRRQTLCFPDALGAQLVHRQCRREHAAAGVRNMLQFERSLHDAIFATGALQDVEDAVKALLVQLEHDLGRSTDQRSKIGSASCRERVCQYVFISFVAVHLKKKKQKRT